VVGRLLVWLLVFVGLSSIAQEVKVAVEITNTASRSGPIYAIEFLSFTKDGMPIGEFPVIPPVPIPPGGTESFGPYSLKEKPNDLVLKGTKRTLVSVGPFVVKFGDLQPCMPASHPDEALCVHLIVTFVAPPLIPVPTPVFPGKEAVEEGWSHIRAGIEEAIRAYAPILKGTKINAEAAVFWGSGERILVVVPADPIVLQPEAILGLIYWSPKKAWALMRIKSPPEFLELLSTKEEAIETLRVKIPPEMIGKAIFNARVHIVTYDEPPGPGGALQREICIGYHKANCDCIGIYIKF